MGAGISMPCCHSPQEEKHLGCIRIMYFSSAARFSDYAALIKSIKPVLPVLNN